MSHLWYVKCPQCNVESGRGFNHASDILQQALKASKQLVEARKAGWHCDLFHDYVEIGEFIEEHFEHGDRFEVVSEYYDKSKPDSSLIYVVFK